MIIFLTFLCVIFYLCGIIITFFYIQETYENYAETFVPKFKDYLGLLFWAPILIISFMIAVFQSCCEFFRKKDKYE